MDLLPDDVLVQVMSLLSLPEVFQLRLVCSRFAALALHRDVWRLRGVGDASDLFDADPWSCRALRLAPCLDSVRVSLSASCPECHQLFTAPCAARSLTITAVGGEGALLAARLIAHQRGLGRLREIDIHLVSRVSSSNADREASKAHASTLFETLASTPGLRVLSIGGCDDYHVPAEPAGPVLASLRRLACQLTPAVPRVLDSLLAGHAATLREVSLSSYCFPSWSSSSSTALLLAGLPLLAVLKCPMLPGMDALVACASLRKVILLLDGNQAAPEEAVSSSVRGVVEAAAAFFRRAHQLRAVHVHGSSDLTNAVEVVSALASSGRSCVEALCIDNNLSQNSELMLALLGALQSLCTPGRSHNLRLCINVLWGAEAGRSLLAAATANPNPEPHVRVSEGPKCLDDHECLAYV
ncbi:uncharacterized protein LOC113207377 [Frankliniella occidentalis]|uniref:Uncharacterized protein LOC113207377 n=1 Tax=Frankliniella occidentalis TaxID=133901 RepID=A0A6J1SFB8_FRAOC|nr:uncharacterized protein LOC113207377 [Frankliniella occidentalis]